MNFIPLFLMVIYSFALTFFCMYVRVEFNGRSSGNFRRTRLHQEEEEEEERRLQ